MEDRSQEKVPTNELLENLNEIPRLSLIVNVMEADESNATTNTLLWQSNRNRISVAT